MECSVCIKEVYKSALTDVHELCYTLFIFCQISQQDVFKIKFSFNIDFLSFAFWQEHNLLFNIGNQKML